MPPKRPSNTRPQGKVEVAQKVKEIKQRQQNWLKQREQSVTSEKTEGADNSSNQTNNGVIGEGPDVEITHSKAAGFNSWLKARGKEKPMLREQRKTPLGASYVISKDQHDVAEDMTTSQLQAPTLPPEDFDQLADQILSRVKQQLNGKPYYAKQYEDLQSSSNQETKMSTPSHSSDYLTHSTDHQNSDTPQPQCQPQGYHEGHPDGHLCPQCAHIMVGPHEPMLIIPCGHNVCRSCSEQEDVDLCAACSCEVSSVTSNIMLKQIISDFQRDRRRVGSARKKQTSRGVNIQDAEKDYKEEIKTLMMRLDVLDSESDNIRDAMSSIQREIDQEKKQVSNIERQEDKVKQEIDELHSQLDALSDHKQQYFDRCEVLEQKHSKQEDKLNLVKDTIRQLNREVEKLSGGGDR